MKIFLFLFYSCFLTFAVQANDTVENSFARLSKIDRFAFGLTGYAGVISQGEKDYRIILSGASPIERFESLYKVGNPQAKCYALVGISILRPDRFQELVLTLKRDKTEVITQNGCFVSHMTIGEVVTQIGDGIYK